MSDDSVLNNDQYLIALSGDNLADLSQEQKEMLKKIIDSFRENNSKKGK